MTAKIPAVQLVRPGDAVFVARRGDLLSDAIAGAMGTWAAHMALVVGVSNGVAFTCETNDFGVVCGTLNRYLDDPKYRCEVYSPDLSEADGRRVAQAALGHWGELYPYPQLASLGLRDLLRRVGIQIRNLYRDGLVCDQLAVVAYQAAVDKPLFSGVDAKEMDTRDVYEAITLRYPNLWRRVEL